LFAPTRRFANAVERNRARRLVREAYRLRKPDMTSSVDMAFVLYPGEYGFAERRKQVDTLLRRAELVAADKD
jgi:ribonuclease P protein component